MFKRTLLAISCVFTLCGCQLPIVPSKTIQYDVTYSIDGHQIHVSASYECVYEDIAWLSERGPAWNIRANKPLYISGTYSDNSQSIVQPLHARLPRCPDSEVEVPSELYVADNTNPLRLKSFDGVRTEIGDHHIKIEKSTLAPVGRDVRAFHEGEPYAPDDKGQWYYAISAKVVSGDEIDKFGLREYVKSRSSISLRNGDKFPFESWTNEDVNAARQYLYNLPFLYHIQSGMEISGDYSDGVWYFARQSSKHAVTWITTVSPAKGASIVDRMLPKTLVSFEGKQIEMPTTKYSSRYFYDSETDALIIFYVVNEQVNIGG